MIIHLVRLFIEQGEEDNMLKKLLSFHFFDLAGIILGMSLVTVLVNNMDLFNMVISPRLYIMIFFCVFLWHSLMWLFAYRFEKAYMWRTISAIIRDFLRVALACISVIGIYFLYKLLGR